MTENATSLTSSADADGPVVGRHLEDVGLDDLAVPEVRLQPHLVPRLRPQVAQHHRCGGCQSIGSEKVHKSSVN